MVKETLFQEQKSTILHIQKTQIQSIQQKKISKTGLRIYHEGLIGIAGAIGKHDDIELEKKAMNMLKLRIPYIPEPTQNHQICLIYNYDVAHGSDFIADMETLLKTLQEEYSDFSFSHNIQLIDHSYTMQNNAGLFLQYQDHFLNLQLLFKHTSSSDLLDGGLSCFGRRYDPHIFLKYCDEKLKAFKKTIELPKASRMPVIFLSDMRTLFSKLIFDLNGRNFSTHGSRLSDKLGKPIYHHDFTFFQSHNSENLLCPFYDTEGSVHMNSNYRVPLVQNGVIIQPYTDKKTAATFKIKHTGSAVSEFDDIPSLGLSHYEVQPGEKSLQELLDGRLGIIIDMAQGGDYTSQGDFASPVQKSYLTDGHSLIGCLPPLQLNSQMEKMFGVDFIGVSKDPLFPLNHEHAVVINFDVSLM